MDFQKLFDRIRQFPRTDPVIDDHLIKSLQKRIREEFIHSLARLFTTKTVQVEFETAFLIDFFGKNMEK